MALITTPLDQLTLQQITYLQRTHIINRYQIYLNQMRNQSLPAQDHVRAWTNAQHILTHARQRGIQVTEQQCL
eukprot:9566784-Prorocentrum_lima.AAC.1